MNLYAEIEYKEILRERLLAMRKSEPGSTLKRMAAKIPLQYTYLSKSLRDSKTHLREDHFFTFCSLLQFLPEEIDYLMLLRSYAIAQGPELKRYLIGRIRRAQRSQELSAEVQPYQSAKFSEDLAYLLDPLSVVVHASLFVDEYARNPRRLCSLLGIPTERLDRILTELARAGYLEKEEFGESVRILKNNIHYGPDHPLMRTHQSLLRTQAASRLQITEESRKQSFVITFNTDHEGSREINERFKVFLKEVEKIASRSRSTGTYQLLFDFFQWY